MKARTCLPRLATPASAVAASLILFQPWNPALANAGGGSPHFVRSIDGTGNNLANPGWGAAGEQLLRKAPPAYADGLWQPAGPARPGARAMSNEMCAQAGPVMNAHRASDFVWQWGQFLDHDIDLSGGADPAEAFDIPVPAGDAWFDPGNTGSAVIPLGRTLWTLDAAGVRQQLNEITAYVDGSSVYGSDDARAAELRALDGTGRLKTTPSVHGPLLPFNVNGFPNAPTALDPSFFLAGDVRSNEQNGLTAMHTLFVREHNRLARIFGFLFPWSSGDLRYQLARAVVGAEIQKITYDDFLPVLLGHGALSPYSGYRPNANAGIANEFSTACYRFGHSMLSPTLLRLDRRRQEIADGHLPLMGAFFNPQEILDWGIEPLLRGLAFQTAQQVDTKVVDDVRNFLFGPPGAGGFDLASLNMQRGRDHGLADYNSMRVAYGLPAVTSFAEISSKPAVQAALQNAYGSVDDVDAWLGGLAEDHVRGALVGPLIRTVLADQFERLRDGDRFWYQRHLAWPLRSWVERQTLSRIIRRNTGIGRELPRDVFRVPRGRGGPVAASDG